MEYKSKINKVIFFGSIIIFGLTSLAHFMYKWTNYNDFIGSITATNESIFQHIKMVFYCTVIFYFISYFIFAKRYKINYKKWIIFPILTFLITSVVIISIYYVLLYGFNMKSAFINISALFIGLLLSSLNCIHIYNRTKTFNLNPNYSLVVIFSLAVLLTYLHYNPAKVDFFYDNLNNTYENVDK